MAEWLVEKGIGEDRALLVGGDQVLAAKMRLPGELHAGQAIEAKLVSRRAGTSRGTVLTDDGVEILIDRLPKNASEGSRITFTVTRSAMAERGRLKRAQGRMGTAPPSQDVFASGTTVRRFPSGLWEDVWSAAWERSIEFRGGTLLFDITPGLSVIDIDGEHSTRELCLAAIPAIARSLRWFDLGGSIAVDFPTLAAKDDRQAVDAALEAALAGWPHERTAMNGFGLVQLVARLEGPSLLHRLALHRTSAAARHLLRQVEAIEGAGEIVVTANPAIIAAIRPELLAELERRVGREVRTQADPALALAGGHAQIVPR